MPPVAPNHFRYIPPRYHNRDYPAAEHNPESFTLLSEQPLYPHPIGDFTVAYYEGKLLSNWYPENPILRFCVGAALDGYSGPVGSGRNSFAYISHGQVLLEFDIAPIQYPFVNVGDVVGFGIDFKKRSIFFTLNGQFVCEKTQNYWDEKLRNLETLHAAVSCHKGFEFSVNFGAVPFMFDILKYQLQRTPESGSNTNNKAIRPAAYDKLMQQPGAIKNSRAKYTYSIIMLIHLQVLIEEDTMAAIDRNEHRVWSVTDCHPVPSVHINPFWEQLTYSNMEELATLWLVESLMANCGLFLQWKEDKFVQTFLKNLAHSGNIPFNEKRDSYEDLAKKIQSEGYITFTMMLGGLMDKFDEEIRSDIGADTIIPAWTQVVTAYRFLLFRMVDLPINHFMIQAVLSYLNAFFNLDFKTPITAKERVQGIVQGCLEYIMGLRLQTLRVVILEKNNRNKAEFEKRSAWIRTLYKHRVPEQLLELMMVDPNVVLPTQLPDRKLLRESSLMANLIRLEHYDELDELHKACGIVELMGLLRLSAAEEQIASEENFVAEAKRHIRREVPVRRRIEFYEITKKNVDKLAAIASLFGLDVTMPTDELHKQFIEEIDRAINKLKNTKTKTKKKTKQQRSLKTELLIGAGLGLLIGLGAAFFVHRRK